jgi:hypothetical protein
VTSGHLKNSFVIPIRDKENNKYGFIQLINSKKNIDYCRYLQPYKEALLGLVQIIINNKKNQLELIKKDNLLKDANFYNQMQENRDNVDDLLDSIMQYFSVQFNAAVISFRIPVLNGHKKEPLFYLRRYFIHQSIDENKRNELTHHYNTDRLIKKKSDMNIVDELRCDYRGKILVNESDSDFSKFGFNLDSNTLIIPIFRDFDTKCIHPQRIESEYCKYDEHHDCKYRFKRLYGVFRVRISKTDLTDNSTNYHFDLEETKKRLGYLSKQISLLLNSIVDKHENESLQIFQNELKNSSFIKIKDFDERCVRIIKKSTNARVCSIYRYDDQTEELTLSATTAKRIDYDGTTSEADSILDRCSIHISENKNVLTRVCKKALTKYIFNFNDANWHQGRFVEQIDNCKDNAQSALIVPMIKKDGKCSGVTLLLGKEKHKHSISTTFWEHDIVLVEFFVSVLTRISESDTERLTFLTHLSHELLAPVTELVYKNDLTVNIAERNIDNYPKRKLIANLRENIDKYMLFKYIISDIEYIYSSSEREIEYNFEIHEKPQQILLEAIRLLEIEAHEKAISITTFISQMPPLFFDKDRMMQVFLNLIKNAIRYSRDNTDISISYNKNSNNYHEICFANYGIGVRNKEKDIIFNLFVRGQEAKSIIERGTGMGLYIIKDIMRVHGGDCTVRRLNHPTEFVITIPELK